MAKRRRNFSQLPRMQAGVTNPTPGQSPQQHRSATTGNGFINPYNFVRFLPTVIRTNPTDTNCPPLRTHEKFSGLSGRIVVEVMTITPLCIPDAEATTASPIASGPQRGEERKIKPFCRVDGKPYIPGSTLKGMLRSVAEAVSNSCFSVLTKDLAVFRDNRDFAVNYRRLGRLKQRGNGDWSIEDIYPDGGAFSAAPKNPVAIWSARKNLYETRKKQLFPDNLRRKKPVPANVQESFQNHFPWYDFLRGLFGDTERRDYDKQGNPLVVRRRGRIEQDRRPLEPERRKGQPVLIRWPVATRGTSPQHAFEPNVLELYERMINSASFRQFHGEHITFEEWQEQYLAAEDEEIFWYRRRQNSAGVSEIGRNFRYKWAYDPHSALPPQLHPCKKPHRLCPCCALFGMVEQRDNEETAEAKVNAFAGKVAIGPAHWSEGNCDFGWVNDHKILGTPKFSCRSFYLEPTDKAAFNVSTDEFVFLDDNGELQPNYIRGRKFYWHHAKVWQNPRDLSHVERLALPNDQRPDETQQNARIEVLMPGAKFEFAIDFENLSDWELGLLLWTIALPYVSDGAHHLGLGKPIGLGTIVLNIKQLDLIDRWRRYNGLFETGLEQQAGFDLADEQGSGKYTKAFREKMQSWHGKEFYRLDNVKDLMAILSCQQPAPASEDVRIIYPPGNRQESQLGVNPEELHYQWFGEMRWREPLRTIEEITDSNNPKFQTLLRWREVYVQESHRHLWHVST